MLTLRFLGELAIERHGEPLRLPQSRKTRALLALLVLGGRPQRRDRLVSMFWELPDDPRGALRWSLSKLRELVDVPGRPRIVADRDQVAFLPHDDDVDVARLRVLAGAADDAADLDELEAMAALAEREPLERLDLPDCAGYQAWLVDMREQVRGLQRRLLWSLVDRCAGDPARALGHARRLLELSSDDAAVVERLAALEAAARAGAAGPSRTADAGAAGPSRAADAGDGPLSPDVLLSRPAVAVLPFENMSGDPEQAYFADAIADDLITALSQWRWFPVIARGTSFAYRGRAADIGTVARETGARYVVQGSVRRAGERVRVTAQLVDAESGVQVWGERYDGTLDDVFALQDELTERIVARVEPELARAERHRAERKGPQNLDAWDLNLRALALLHHGELADLLRAKTLLEESLRLDPRSSHGYANLALCNYHEALFGWTHDPVACSNQVVECSRRAVELDEGNWLGHALLGISILWNRREFDTAAAAVRRAVELNPSAALARQFLGCVLSFDGHPGEAIPHLFAAIRLNPLRDAANLLLADLALAHLLDGSHEDAAHYARWAIAQFDGDVRAWQRLTAALGHLGRGDEAAEALAQLERRQGPLTADYMRTTYPFRYPEHLDVLWQGLLRAGWQPD